MLMKQPAAGYPSVCLLFVILCCLIANFYHSDTSKEQVPLIPGLGTKSKASYFLSRNTLSTVCDNGSLDPSTRDMAGNSPGQLGHIILTSSPPNGIYYSSSFSAGINSVV